MHRREVLKKSAALGLLAALPFPLSAAGCSRAASQTRAPDADGSALPPKPLRRPADGSAIAVAFLISDDAVVIDFAGPWEVFTNVMPGGRMGMNTFRLYTVAQTNKPIKASGGMTVVPDYTLGAAPAPNVVVIPAQSNSSAAVLDWIRRSAKTADVTMSVCTGAYLLAPSRVLADSGQAIGAS